MKWTDIPDVDLTLHRLSGTLGLNERGEVTLGWYGDFDNGVAAIARRASFPREVPFEQQMAFARSAIIAAVKAGDLTREAITPSLRQSEIDYLKMPRRPFILVTSASVTFDKALSSTMIDGALISFRRAIPPKYSVPDGLPRARRRDRLPTWYSAVTVAVSARCIYAASTSAFEAYDFFRAIWNFYYNRAVWRISDAHKPSNEVLAGPIHTLHEPSGKPATETYWFDPMYAGPASAKNVASDLPELGSFARRVRRRIANSPIGPFIRLLLLRYGRALDEPSPSSSFLRLWSVLEDATATAQDERYEVTIRRAAFIWDDPMYHRLVLKDLRIWRNALVHEGSEPTRGREVVEELRKYVEGLLEFLLAHSSRFKSKQEYTQILDLPYDDEELGRRARMFTWARKWRERR